MYLQSQQEYVIFLGTSSQSLVNRTEVMKKYNSLTAG